MKQKTTKEHLIDIHTNTATMALAALLTVFHLQLQMSHGSKHTPVHGVVPPQATLSDGSNFEREREIHPTHGSYGARARYATTTGS